MKPIALILTLLCVLVRAEDGPALRDLHRAFITGQGVDARLLRSEDPSVAELARKVVRIQAGNDDGGAQNRITEAALAFEKGLRIVDGSPPDPIVRKYLEAGEPTGSATSVPLSSRDAGAAQRIQDRAARVMNRDVFGPDRELQDGVAAATPEASGAAAPSAGPLRASDFRPASPYLATEPPPSPVVAANPVRPASGVLSELGAWSAQTAKGYATGAGNLVLDLANLSNRGANLLLSATPISYRYPTDRRFAPESSLEENAQNAVEVASLLTGVAGIIRSAPRVAAKAAEWTERLAAVRARKAPTPALAKDTPANLPALVEAPEYADMRWAAYSRVRGLSGRRSGAFAARNKYMDQFDDAAKNAELELWPDRNFMARAEKGADDMTKAALYALSSGREFHVARAVVRERNLGHVKLLAEGQHARSAQIRTQEQALSEVLGDRVHVEAERLPHIRDAVARFFAERKVSAEDAQVAADIFVSCRPDKHCAIVTFDRGFKTLRSWRDRRAPGAPTKVEKDFQKLIDSFPQEVRGQLGRELPEVILLN